jgi:hypothetical protein
MADTDYFTQALEMRRGDTQPWTFPVVDPDTGGVFDLTGWDAYFTVKRLITDADPGLFQLTIGAGIAVLDAAGGILQVRPRRADTSGITDEPRLIWDLQLSQAGAPDLTHTVAGGTLLVIRDVTRAP